MLLNNVSLLSSSKSILTKLSKPIWFILFSELTIISCFNSLSTSFLNLFQLGNLSDKFVNLLPSFLCCVAYYIDFEKGVNCFIKGF